MPEWLKTADSILNSSAVSSLLKTKKPTPAPSVPTPIVEIKNPIDSGNNNKMLITIGASVLAFVLVLVIVLRKK